MVLICIVQLIQQRLVINSKQLILQQRHVSLLVFYLLESLLCLEMVAHKLAVFPLLFLLHLIDVKKLGLCVEFVDSASISPTESLGILVGVSHANESITGNLKVIANHVNPSTI